MEIRKLQDLELAHKKILVRLDLNVPIKDGKITDDTRIRAALPTLRYLLEKTNKIALMSHLGRPDGEVMPEYSFSTIMKVTLALRQDKSPLRKTEDERGKRALRDLGMSFVNYFRKRFFGYLEQFSGRFIAV